MIDMPVIDLSRCDGCGLCVTVCRCGAIIMVDNTITIVETDRCGWCGECELVCPLGAISRPFEIVIQG